jgi:Ser/Thr protein kinase RdoA (MazF antagonist)
MKKMNHITEINACGSTPMNTDTTPRFTAVDAKRIVHEVFGLAGAITPLPSERDQNFALTTVDGARHVLKFARSDEDRAVLDFQNAALKHLENRVSTLTVPRVVPSLSGQDITMVADATGRAHLIRLVVWLDGELFAKSVPHDAKLLSSLGRALAELDLAFADFQHPCMNRHLHWDLRHIDPALSHSPRLSTEQRHIVEHFKPHWETVRWDDLRKSVIHGDANDYNVLVRHGRVAAFIDFGDMVHSATACDLAIGATYAMFTW